MLTIEQLKTEGMTLIRMLDAPVERVYKARTDETQMAAWRGPKDFTNPTCEMDVCPGGKIYIDMTGPDGTSYPMRGEFVEIIENKKIVMRARCLPLEDGSFALEDLTTVTFESVDGKTKLTVHSLVVKVADEAKEAVGGMIEGWTQSLDRLENIV